MTRGRVAVVVVLLLLVATGWTAWVAWQAYQGLTEAERATQRLRGFVERGDRSGQQLAVSELREAATQVEDATGGLWWSVLTVLPVVGDDAEAVRLIGSTLDTVSAEGVEPLLGVTRRLDDVTSGGRIDLDVVRGLKRPVSDAAAAFGSAADETEAVDTEDLVGVLGDRFADYRAQVGDAASGLEAGATAVELLPAMAGGDGPGTTCWCSRTTPRSGPPAGCRGRGLGCTPRTATSACASRAPGPTSAGSTSPSCR